MKMLWKFPVALLLVALATGSMSVAHAQPASLDPSSDPNYGTWTLSNYPDPLLLTIIAGGDIDSSRANVGSACVGFVTSNPDMKFRFDGGPLRAFFAARGDTTLIVSLPDGSFVCNDDTAGTNPVVDISNAPAGTYSLWVGTYGADFIPGYIVVTSGQSLPGALVSDLLGSASGGQTITATPATTSSGSLDASAAPTFSALNLAPGFQPDPTTVAMAAGGSVNVGALNLGTACRGFVASAPDVTINYSPAGRFLRIFYQSDADTTLVVRLPDGTFMCNDDYSGRLDPLVDISAPAAGTYSIWVGAFSSASTADGTLVLSSGNMLDPTNFQ